MFRKLCVFRVTGGEPFRIQVKGNPVVKHDGGADSILRVLCTDEQAHALEKEIRSHGCRVFVNLPVETEDQKRERKNVLTVLGGEKPFPCVRCPECAWFDPHLEDLCGAAIVGSGWDAESIDGASRNEKFREDLTLCPLRGVPT